MLTEHGGGVRGGVGVMFTLAHALDATLKNGVGVVGEGTGVMLTFFPLACARWMSATGTSTRAC